MIKLKPADICFTTNKKSKLSKIFRWFMGSKWSHTFIVREQTPRTIYITETSSFEVIHNELTGYLDSSLNTLEIWRPTQVSDEQAIQITDECAKNLETIYGYLQFISLAIRCLFKKIHLNIPNFIKKGLICDELVLTGYTISDIPSLHGINPKSIETEEFYQLIINAKNKDGSQAFVKIYEQL